MSALAALSAGWEGLASPSGALRSATCTEQAKVVATCFLGLQSLHLPQDGITL